MMGVPESPESMKQGLEVDCVRLLLFTTEMDGGVTRPLMTFRAMLPLPSIPPLAPLLLLGHNLPDFLVISPPG